MINVRRRAIITLFRSIKVDKPVLLPLSSEEIRELFFDLRKDNKTGELYYILNDDMLSIRDKIDYSNFSFDNVFVGGENFCRMYGVKLNPQTNYDKSLKNTTLKGVVFIGNNNLNEIDLFEGVNIEEADFTGSIGAKINPQTIHDKNLSNATLTDVDFTGFSFKGAKVWRTNFKGSKGAVLNPNELYSVDYCTLVDVTLLDLYAGSASFSTSKNYQDLLNKQKEYSEKIFSLIESQLPPQIEEKLEVKEEPKQKRKWFGN